MNHSSQDTHGNVPDHPYCHQSEPSRLKADTPAPTVHFWIRHLMQASLLPNVGDLLSSPGSDFARLSFGTIMVAADCAVRGPFDSSVMTSSVIFCGLFYVE